MKPIPTGPAASRKVQAGPRHGSDASQCSDRSRVPSELERARAHLRHMQAWLYKARVYHGPVESLENTVLAALVWVWEEQEKAKAPSYWHRSRWRAIAMESH